MRRRTCSTVRSLAAGMPAALAGSIALSVLASPAAAVATDTASFRHVASPRAQAAASGGYTVEPGDTVSAIAARHGLRTADVLAWNGLSWSSSTIRPGQVLQLSAPAGAPAAPAAAAPAPPAPAPPAASYTVVAGDTMSAIAGRHGVSTDALLAANALTRASIIYPGQAVVIPGSAVAAPAAAPPAAAPAPAPGPAPSGGAYVVVAGDTISAIAGRHGISTDSLLAANALTRASIIYPGQTVTIPVAGSVPAPAVQPVASSSAALDAEQTLNARTIIGVGRGLGLPDRAIAIALATAMQESSLRNLGYGPDDSLGLFQQRPSMGWGSEAEVLDVDRSTRVFYGGPADPNGARSRGLLDISGWESMGFSQAAQAVQVSAYPDLYCAWETSAYAWLAALG